MLPAWSFFLPSQKKIASLAPVFVQPMKSTQKTDGPEVGTKRPSCFIGKPTSKTPPTLVNRVSAAPAGCCYCYC